MPYAKYRAMCMMPKEAAYIAQRLGHKDMAEQLLKEAEELKQKFNEVFWDEQMGTYILALDGNKKPCRVVSSNAGHLLYSGIATPEERFKPPMCL